MRWGGESMWVVKLATRDQQLSPSHLCLLLVLPFQNVEVAGKLELGELLCDSLEDLSSSTFLRFAISSTEVSTCDKSRAIKLPTHQRQHQSPLKSCSCGRYSVETWRKPSASPILSPILQLPSKPSLSASFAASNAGVHLMLPIVYWLQQ